LRFAFGGYFLGFKRLGAAGLALVKADRSKVSSLIETNYIGRRFPLFWKSRSWWYASIFPAGTSVAMTILSGLLHA
jgi:hypothetical protein